jgi:hypothetical protein
VFGTEGSQHCDNNYRITLCERRTYCDNDCKQIKERLTKSKSTYPSHTVQITFLLSCSLAVLPLYISSNETLKQESASLWTFKTTRFVAKNAL